MKWFKTFLLTLALWTGMSAALSAQGQITFAETTYDLGEVKEGDQPTHTFIFTNTGDQPLTVVGVQPDCGCTILDWQKGQIAPGAQGTLDVIYDTRGRPGPFNKAINIFTDGEPNLLVVYITGEVKRPQITEGVTQGNVMFAKDVHQFGMIPAGRVATYWFRMENKSQRPIKVTGVSVTSSQIAIEYPETPIFNGDVVEVKVMFSAPRQDEGKPFDYQITLQTDDATQPVKTLRVRGQVGAPLSSGGQ